MKFSIIERKVSNVLINAKIIVLFVLLDTILNEILLIVEKEK